MGTAHTRESQIGLFGMRAQTKRSAYDTYEREVRDLPWSEFRTTVVVELYRVCCPDYGVNALRKR